MKNQRFGIEIEMTGLTRAAAARVIAGHFSTTATHVGGSYDAYAVRDTEGRQWKIVSDASIQCESRRGSGAAGHRMPAGQVSPLGTLYIGARSVERSV